MSGEAKYWNFNLVVSVVFSGHPKMLTRREYKVHSYNRNGLCVVGFMYDHYPVRSAFSVLNKHFGDSWRSMQADSTQSWPYLNDALTKFQDPVEADKLLKIQRELDETKIILHKTIDSVLERGKKMDSLVQKSSDLSAASQERRDVPAEMGARAHGEVGLGSLVLFRYVCVYRRGLGVRDEFWRERWFRGTV
nr:VAMP-like protein YKT61 [Tanacetum cinerariifolium]